MEEATAVPPTRTDSALDAVTVHTTRFGPVTVAQDKVVAFPRGLVGIPAVRRFTFLHREDAASPFFWLQSLDDPALAFVVCEPQFFFPNYNVPLAREEQQLLSIRNAADGIVCLILVVPEDPSKITANLRGPLVINTERRLGMQLVLQGDGYPTKALVFGGGAGEGESCSC